MMTISTIDKSTELGAIKQKYGNRYFANQDAIKEACDLWKVQSNEHGVIQNFKEEELVNVGKCSARLKYIETGNGHLLIGLDVSTAIGGYGYSPSVWNAFGFSTYWDTREFAVQKFITYFQEEAISKNSCSSYSNKQNALKASEILKGKLTPQLDLF